MKNNFEYEKISAQAYEYLTERLSYKFKGYIDKCNIEFISQEVCKNFLFELYNGRYHTLLSC